MRHPKRRPIHYSAICLYDGTVIAAYPVRKPTPKIIKRDKLKIDEDGICRGWMESGKVLSDSKNENRFRFHDIISNRLNTRRTIREMVLPQISKLQEDMDGLRTQLGEIQQLLSIKK